ncbi:hypothetical protein D3C74_239240 [compost metagenome]
MVAKVWASQARPSRCRHCLVEPTAKALLRMVVAAAEMSMARVAVAVMAVPAVPAVRRTVALLDRSAEKPWNYPLGKHWRNA